jgi:nicotinamidase-related amidase
MSAARKKPEPVATPLAEEYARDGVVLLIVDMLSGWDFPDADRLLPGAERITPRIAALRRRCHDAGVPVVFANDNRGRWRSDFRSLLSEVVAEGPGAAIGAALAPREDDYFILKPKHSAFHATPLRALLEHMKARHLIMTGVSSDQCVLLSAAAAKMHDYRITVPRDAVAAQSPRRQRLALDYLAEVLEVATTPSSRVRLPAAGPG